MAEGKPEIGTEKKDEEPNEAKSTFWGRVRRAIDWLLHFFYKAYIVFVVIPFFVALPSKAKLLKLPNWSLLRANFDAEDWRIPFLCIGSVVAGAAFIAAVWAVSRLIRDALRLRGKYPGSGLFVSLRNIFVEMQTSQKYYHLYYAQTGLRACFAFAVVAAAMGSLLSFPQGPNGDYPVVGLNALHILISAAYAAICIFSFRHDRRTLRSRVPADPPNPAQEIDPLVRRVFWITTVIDMVFISFVWSTTILPSRPFHLGYIIPVLTIWLFRSERAIKIMGAVAAGLFFHVSIVFWSVAVDAQLASNLGLTGWRIGIPAAEFVLNISFWFCIGLILTLFRDAQNRLKEALDTSDIIRNGLETLAVQQGLAVFAKDMNRHFIFANSIFRQKLAKFLKQNTVPWSAIKYKSDEEIGLTEKEFPEYKKSDLAVLGSDKEEDEHYQKSEPSFSEPGGVIWTRKELIRDPRDKERRLGLIGYVVDGLPIEFHQIQLPFYASLKDEQGHVLWANAMHLDKLAPAIDRLYQNEYKNAAADKITTKAARLRKINNGDGPFDSQLYGDEAGRGYRELDEQIMDLAKRYGQTEKFNEAMEDAIKKRKLPRRLGRTGTYPLNGWLEYHKFPKPLATTKSENAPDDPKQEQSKAPEVSELEEEGVWVEVWKMPWWEKRIVGDQITYVVKGVLVFFEDVHASYLRERIFWHAVNKHLMHVTVASDIMLKAVPFQSDLAGRLDSCLSIGEIVRRMLFLFQAFVEGSDIHLSNKRDLGSQALESLLRTVETAFRPSVRLELHLQPFLCEWRGEDLFCIVLALVVRAAEATQEFCGNEITLPPVHVSVHAKDDRLHIAVIDNAIPHDHQKNVHSADNPLGWARVSEKYIPGEGYYIAKNIATQLWRVSKTKSPGPNTVFRSTPNPAYPAGSVVSVELPLDVFKIPPKTAATSAPASPPSGS